MFRLLLLCFVCSILGAESLSLDFLKSKPAGIARDFYIWMFLKESSTTTQDAKAAYKLVTYKSVAIQEAMRAKGALSFGIANLCGSLPLKELALKDAHCIALGLNLSRVFASAKHRSERALLELIQGKLAKDYPKLNTSIGILLHHNILKALFASSVSTLVLIYNALPYEQRLQLLDHHINPTLLESFINQNNPRLNQIIQRIVVDARFTHFKKSLAKANITNTDNKTFFALGINAVIENKEDKALDYFKRSAYLASTPFLKDKSLFWQYLISQDPAILESLSQSSNPNLFSLYANFNLHKVPTYQLVTTLQAHYKDPPFDITDPFAWQVFRDKTLAMKEGAARDQRLESLKTPQTLPHLAYFLSRYNTGQYYFLAPYENIISWSSLQEKALAYAIARQESLLLPALVSRSYALGLMQIMPFNVAHFAAQMGVGPTKLTDMFNPKIALPFGNHYLNYLKAEFEHPLFVAYCYNAGPGFFKRLLTQRHFFRHGKFEPWLSMELVPYEETRIYGQKVMANYIIYQRIFAPYAKPLDLNAFFNATLKSRR
ncbi:lytic transglycosylase domain-containing protein [Helicobacter baculiformis]|uniref:Lytic transglycosylase domain-containing protein n=1 Tax=Helicobacter baculiformis TaxID=427351 RepID=A0ABV7ZGY1_9HELI|nr:lytic transglycosylase domain-containing protein [Helicobacter baculiformis]